MEVGSERDKQREARQRAGCRFTTSVCASLAKRGGRSYKRVVHPHGRMKGGRRGGWWDPGTAGKGVDSLGAARLPKQ